MEILSFLILAILIGLIPAAIAQKKGRNFLGWWLFGALLFIVALPAALNCRAKPGYNAPMSGLPRLE